MPEDKPLLLTNCYTYNTCMKIGLIREGKVPIDKRVALSPAQCKEVLERYPFLSFEVQKSPFRCFKDAEYEAAGIPVVEDVSHCDLLMGIKEVPVQELLPNKTYCFFTHTIKKQLHNRNLLISLLNLKVRAVDYECLTDERGERVLAFGHFAGLVGAYNGLRAYGERFRRFSLPAAHKLKGLQELYDHFRAEVKLPPIRICLVGRGRAGNGAAEMLDQLGIRKVSPQQFLQETFAEAVYTQLGSGDYHQHRDGKPFDRQEFHQHPGRYASAFMPYAEATDVLMMAAFWHPHAPRLFTREQMLQPSFRIKVVADITCDIDGALPCTRHASTIADPFYDYNPESDKIESLFSSPKCVTVMAIDNLPNEMPRAASEAFGRQLIDKVLPALLERDQQEMVYRATITDHGRLTPRFTYLHDFVEGKE